MGPTGSRDVRRRHDRLERAVARAVDRRFGRLLTEPMMVKELAVWFACDRSRVVLHLNSINGCRQIGRRWRVPLWSMPPAYLQQLGLLPRE